MHYYKSESRFIFVQKVEKVTKREQNGYKLLRVCNLLCYNGGDGKDLLSFMTEGKATLKVWSGRYARSCF